MKRALSIFCCSLIMSGSPVPAFAQVARVPRVVALSHAGPAGAAISASPIALNPALNGGVSLIKGNPAPTLVVPMLSALAVPTPAHAPIPAGVAADKPADALAAAKTLAAAVDDEVGAGFAGSVDPAKGGDAAAEAANKTFDGGAGNGTAVDGSVPVDSNGAPLNQLYPRVVFLQDVFSGPASEKTVAYVNFLVNAGVHVVFMTWRPQKGAGSADEVLLSRVKQSRNNPVVVVSYNGGKISLHGRAANPQSIIESVGAFPAEALAKIKGFAPSAEAAPSEAEAFSLTVREARIGALNGQLKSAGLDYAAEAHPSVPGAAIIHSMPLRFSLARVMEALEAQFMGENLAAAPEKFLILADSMKSPRFSNAFPRNAEIQVVKNGGAVENVLGAVLGDRKLDGVSLKLGKLRQYVEYWEPSHRSARTFAGHDEGGGIGGYHGGGGGGDRRTRQMFAMFVGTIMYRLMAQLYDDVFRGQHQLAKLTVLQAQLRAMWYNPLKHGVYVNKSLAKAINSPAWKTMSRGYLEYANSYLTNYYFREFSDYTRAARAVQENYVGLSTDRKSLITLEFVSAATGKLYKIYTRIPRVMRLETAEGLTLTAYAYRTGKETPDDGEEFLARVLAMAMLKGHARKGTDGRWHHGSPEGKVIARLQVQLEYRSSARAHVFDTADFLRLEEDKVVNGPIVQEIISAIEREEADAEYQAYYEEQEQRASKEDLKKPKKPAATAKPAAKPRKGK